MDRTKLEEYISSLIDGEQIPPEHEEAVREALRSDERWQREHASIKSTKALLQKHEQSIRHTTPADARVKVLELVRNETRSQSTAEPSTDQSRFRDFFRLLFSRYRLVTAAVIVVLGMLVILQQNFPGSQTELTNTTVSPRDFIADVVNNYQEVASGNVMVEKSTSSFEELSKFFRSNGINYRVRPVSIKGTLIGGFVSKLEGEHIGHVVYRDSRNELVYFCQVPIVLFDKNCLELEDAYRQELERGETSRQELDDGIAVALSKYDETISAMVASVALTNLN